MIEIASIVIAVLGCWKLVELIMETVAKHKK